MAAVPYLQEMWQLLLDGQAQGVWFWAAIYSLFVCSYSIFFQVRTRFWPYTEGVLVGCDVEVAGGTHWVTSEQNYLSKALYTYSVLGKEYNGKRISPWAIMASHNARFILQRQIASIERLPNGHVKVFYNPTKPHKSFLIIASKLGICITATICVLPFVSYYLHFYI